MLTKDFYNCLNTCKYISTVLLKYVYMLKYALLAIRHQNYKTQTDLSCSFTCGPQLRSITVKSLSGQIVLFIISIYDQNSE